MTKISRREWLIKNTAIMAAGAGLPLCNATPCEGQGWGTQRPIVSIDPRNPSVTWDAQRCRGCGACYQFCSTWMTVSGRSNPRSKDRSPVCIQCGQCSIACPTYAITERYDYPKVQAKIADKDKIVVATTSPAVRAALGECFRLAQGQDYQGKMVAALKALKFDYILDTTFAADLTIMEEASELAHRLSSDKQHTMPLFTSCCPSWISFAEIFYPELLPHISTAKSPIMMQGTMIKTYFAKKHRLDPAKIVNVAIAPCTAKKFEIRRPEMNASGTFLKDKSIRDMDYVLTTRELAYMFYGTGQSFANLPDAKFDSIMGPGSGAGMIFGNTGGVTGAALRGVWALMTDKPMPDTLLKFEPARKLKGVREAKININGREIRAAIVHSTGYARQLISAIKRGAEKYDFVEVMACPGGCIGGGGQPKPQDGLHVSSAALNSRMKCLYQKDESNKIRKSADNPEIKAVYQEFLGKPLSDQAKSLLHTRYAAR